MRTTNGIIDPNERLAYGDADDMLAGHEPSEEQVQAINDAIEQFAHADPMGHSDYEADRLRARVAKILGGPAS